MGILCWIKFTLCLIWHLQNVELAPTDELSIFLKASFLSPLFFSNWLSKRFQYCCFHNINQKINHSGRMIQLLKAGSHSPQSCPSESLSSLHHRVATLLKVKIWVLRLVHSHSVKPLEDMGTNPVNSAEVSKGRLRVLLARQTGLDFLPLAVKT